MKKIFNILVIALIILLIATGCSNTDQYAGTEKEHESAEEEIIVSAAASLRYALTELKDVYEKENPGITITYNFASSGSLQKQIEQGAPADLFLSAGKTQMDALAEKDLIVKDTRIDLLENELVLIVGADNNAIQNFEDLTQVAKIAIGTPESVPAGKYAKEALLSMNLWDSLQDKFVQAKDVTQVLTYVETGNVEAGLLYASDTYQSSKIKTVAVAPAETHSPIVYPAAVVKTSTNADQAAAFLKFLESSEAQTIFSEYGFKTK